jgi:hypothetical protein
LPFVAREKNVLFRPSYHPGIRRGRRERRAELVALELLLVGGEEVLGVERIVAHELEIVP